MLNKFQEKIFCDSMDSYIQSQYQILARFFEDLERIGGVKNKEQAIEQLSADLPCIVKEFVLILISDKAMPFNILQRAITHCILSLMESNTEVK